MTCPPPCSREVLMAKTDEWMPCVFGANSTATLTLCPGLSKPEGRGSEKKEVERAGRLVAFHCNKCAPWFERKRGREVRELRTTVPSCKEGGATRCGAAAAMTSSILSTVLSQ